MLLHPHRHAQFVTVSDEREGEALRHFGGVRFGDQPAEGETATVLVAVDNADNGFGWPVGAIVQPLKHLGDNVYGA